MKTQKDSKVFAFKLAAKAQPEKSTKQWAARDGVATAGCSGPWARANDYRWGRDAGVYC